VTDTSDDDSNLEDDPTETPLTQTPSIALIKTGTYVDNAPVGVTNPGDQISYTFTVTIRACDLNECDGHRSSAGHGESVAIRSPPWRREPPQHDHYGPLYDHPGRYQRRRGDNQALATGTTPTGGTVTDTSDDDSNLEDDPTETPLTQTPSIALIKTGTYVDNAPVGVTNPGDQISYTFTVTIRAM